MYRQERNCAQQIRTPIWSGVLLVGILWALAIWSVGGSEEYGVYDLEHSNVVAAQDIPLHASGDYSPSVKRFYSRHQDSHSPLKHFDPHSDFPSAELSNFFRSFSRRQKNLQILPSSLLASTASPQCPARATARLIAPA